MNIDFILDSIESRILQSVKDNQNTMNILIENIEATRKSMKIIDLLDRYRDLEECSSGYLYSADPIYCSSMINIKNTGTLCTHVVNHNGDIYVYMFNIVHGINVYTKSPFIFIGSIDNNKLIVSKTLDEDIKKMALSVTFRKYIKDIINDYNNQK